jgi:hypothetical protein
MAPLNRDFELRTVPRCTVASLLPSLLLGPAALPCASSEEHTNPKLRVVAAAIPAERINPLPQRLPTPLHTSIHSAPHFTTMHHSSPAEGLQRARWVRQSALRNTTWGRNTSLMNLPDESSNSRDIPAESETKHECHPIYQSSQFTQAFEK